MFAITKLLNGRDKQAFGAWPVRLAALLAVALLAAGGVLGWMALRPSPSAAHTTTPPLDGLEPAEPATVLVFVSGAVAHPGLYQLSPSARIADAVAAAGGLTSEADPGRLPDLAARIHDGRQVNVPFVRSGTRTSASARLDVNTASVDELRDVPGMPLGLPEAIVDYRERFGPFRSLTELRILLGLDTGVLTAIRPYVRAVVPAQ